MNTVVLGDRRSSGEVIGGQRQKSDVFGLWRGADERCSWRGWLGGVGAGEVVSGFGGEGHGVDWCGWPGCFGADEMISGGRVEGYGVVASIRCAFVEWQ